MWVIIHLTKKFILLKYTIQLIFSVRTGLCTIILSNLRRLSSPPKACPVSSHSPSPSPTPTTTNLFSLLIDVPLLDILYKWNHIIYSLLWLAFYTNKNTSKAHPYCTMCITVPTPFYCWIIFHLWICHILFIHSSISEHLGFFVDLTQSQSK